MTGSPINHKDLNKEISLQFDDFTEKLIWVEDGNGKIHLLRDSDSGAIYTECETIIARKYGATLNDFNMKLSNIPPGNESEELCNECINEEVICSW